MRESDTGAGNVLSYRNNVAAGTGERHNLEGPSLDESIKSSHRDRNRTFVELFKPLQAEAANIDCAFAVNDLLCKRLSNGRRVFKSVARTS